MPDRKASPAQARYLRDLASTRAIWGPSLTPANTLERMQQFLAEPRPTGEVSNLIRQARAAHPYPANQIPATARQREGLRVRAAEVAIYGLALNREETIAKVEETLADTNFTSQDALDLLRQSYRAAPHPTAQTPLRLSDIEGIDGLNISEGHYAVFDEEDTLRFYRVYTPASGTHRGVAVIRRYAGDMLKGLYPREALDALRAIDADPDAAAYRYADTFTRCWVCGKVLTDSISRLLSVGPTCRGFQNHNGLRVAAAEVDHDPERRKVYRALREWALARGFSDPREKSQRDPSRMTASRLASAWSGLPGMLALSPDAAVAAVEEALTGKQVSDSIRDGLLSAPKDTLLVLIESGVLSTDVMNILVSHPIAAIQSAASEYFLTRLGM